MKSTVSVLFIFLGVLRSCFCTVDPAAVDQRFNKPTRAVFCQDSKGWLECPRGQIIKVVSANYGRLTGASVCPPTLNNVTSCSANSSLATARCLCDNKNSCALFSSDYVFRDPCVGTSKYLQIEFRCEGAHTVKCEERSCQIDCPNNEVMDIELASYGGRSSSLPAPNEEARLVCLFLPIVSVLENCQRQSSCFVGTARFDDCMGMYKYKYFEVRYKCL